MKNKWRKYRKFFIIFPIILIFGLSAIVYWLWNAILPEVTGVQMINYWQAMGILVLSKILFSGFGGGFRRRKKHFGGNPFFHKLKNMTPEQREEFKVKWREKRGGNSA